MTKKSFRGDKDRISVEELDRETIGFLDSIRSGPEMIPLDQIAVDWTLQPRLNQLDKNKVREYADFLSTGAEMDAVTIYEQADDRFILLQGFHRYTAYQESGRTEIPAEIKRGDFETALRDAEDENLKHGIQYTSADKKNLFFIRIKRRDASIFVQEGVRLSNVEIAEGLGVGEATIRRWWSEYERQGEDEVGELKRAGRDGKVRDTTDIGRATQETATTISQAGESTSPNDEVEITPLPHSDGGESLFLDDSGDIRPETQRNEPTRTPLFDMEVQNAMMQAASYLVSISMPFGDDVRARALREATYLQELMGDVIGYMEDSS